MRFAPLIALLVACAGRHEREEADFAEVREEVAAVSYREDPEVTGLKIRLFEVAGEAPAAAEGTRRVSGDPLAQPAVDALLRRVPDLEGQEGDRLLFALREGAPPPPLSGSDTRIPFPPLDGGDAPEMPTGPLEVLRAAPEGEVPIAPHVALTFSQPMVAVTSQDEAANTVPVEISPEPGGRWRWLGTRTLLFDPEPRLPMATEYTVEVPAGTRSATGATLDEAHTFRFATPPPTLSLAWPPDWPAQPLRPVVVLAFDQRVEPEAILARTKLLGAGRPHAVRLATRAEVAEDPGATDATRDLEPGRWVALVPTEPLPTATHFQVVLEAGAPSAEGPRTTARQQYGSFSTYAPLSIVEHHCGWQDECPPTSGWVVRFNNPLDPDRFDPGAVKVSPEVPGFFAQASGDVLSMTGAFQGRTAYTVTVPASLTDAFGQTLGADRDLVFKVGPAEATLSSPGDTMVVLDPAGGGKLPVFSTNHRQLRVQVHAVDVGDWPAWVKWLERLWYDDATPGRLPGKPVFDGRITPADGPDRMVETALDLAPYLKDGHGQLVVLIEPTKQPGNRWERQLVARWVQATDLGVTAFTDATHVVGWATELATGAPVDGVEVSVDGARGTTGADGLAKLELPSENRPHPLLVARKGGDVAILPASQGIWGGTAWVRRQQLEQLRWYVTDDRGLYKPGETVRVFGWLRRFDPRPDGDVEALGGAATAVRWRLTGARGNDLGSGEAEVSALGGFQLSFDLPGDANLGTARLYLEAPASGLDGTSTTHPIRIQEFRRPEFEVTTSADAGPHVLGSEGRVDLTASYYAGGGLPGADVAWNAFSSAGSYVPPGHPGYAFGTWSPWWMAWSPDVGPTARTTLQGTTDAAGAHHLGLHFEAMNPPRPTSVRVEGTVMDVNRQAWTSSATLLVHPSTAYVGLKTERSFVEQGEDIDVDLMVVDLDGAPLAKTPVEVRMARLEGRWTRGRGWQETEQEIVECDEMSDAKGRARCSFETVRGGSYRLLATVRDEHGRPNETELRVWVSGAELEPARSVSLEAVTLVPEQRELKPGDVARVLVQAPFHPAEGVLTLRRSGLVRTERFTLTEPTTTLEIPLLDAYVPDVTVQVDLLGSAPRIDDDGNVLVDQPRRVAHATGKLTFQVPPISRALAVDATPQHEALAPGSETSIAVEVRDAEGAPVDGAEVAVVVVDESILALTGFRLPDPIEVFYAARGAGAWDRRLREHVALADPTALQAPEVEVGMLGGAGYGGGGAPQPAPPPLEEAPGASGPALRSAARLAAKERSDDDASEAKRLSAPSGGNPQAPIAMRADFSATALFAPGVRTDASGRAVVPFRVPDSLTRYRVMVVAVDAGNAFGSTDAAITARLPLMVRPSAPRFLNFGDQVELPVVLQNQTDREMTVELAVRGTNLRFVDAITDTLPDLPDLSLSTAGRRVSVPAHDRVEVRFPAATLMAGTARLQFVGASADASDAQTLDLPVWTPATTEAFATYGEIDDGGLVQPVKAPPDVWTQFGGLEITTSSTQLQALTDAVLYLHSYPFECNEQIASRVLAIASLRDVLSAFEAEQLPSASALEAQVADDLQRLAGRQHWNGGFAFWRRGDEPWPFLSIHVANTFARARGKGFDVPDDAFRRSLRHLRDIESHLPSWYGQRTRWFLRAYALDVRRRMGDADVDEARRLYAEAGTDGLGIDALAFLLPTLHEGGASRQTDEILRHLGNRVSETAAGAHFVTSYEDGAHVLLHSERRADGIVLESLIEVEPDSDLVPKVVRSLLGHRVKGRWSNTQENAFVLMALDRYFRVYEKETPDFVARIWLGEGYVGEHAFRGRSTERAHARVPMGYLSESRAPRDLTLMKDGDDGRLYYRIGVRYAPRDLRLEPADHGFAVERRYEAIDDPDDVRRDDDGAWRIRAGARVRVRVTMVADGRRTHVALVDPLPAGLEAQNPALATTGTLPGDPSALDSQRFWWWSRTWFEHQNLRDERVEAFASLLWDGVHEYTYVARATTPGRFVVPPPKAEEMYHPETFGRGATDRVIVE